MKKLRTLSNLWVTGIRKTTGVLIVAIGLGCGFWSVTADPSGGNDSNSNIHSDNKEKDKNDDKDKDNGDGDDKGQCLVCGNDKKKAKEHRVDCNKVHEFLTKHPGSYRGPCQDTQVTPVTNP